MVRLHGLCLPAGAVEGEHQLRAELIAQGMLRDEPLELADERAVFAEGEIGLDPAF